MSRLKNGLNEVDDELMINNPELEEDLKANKDSPMYRKPFSSSTPNRGQKRHRGVAGNLSIKDKNELVDMNKENLLEHCLVLQFEINELLSELDKLTQKQDDEFAKSLQLKSKCKEKIEKMKFVYGK